MISLYSGTPGSGKSLHAARDIYNRLKAKKPVICNFYINPDSFTEEEYSYYTYIDNVRFLEVVDEKGVKTCLGVEDLIKSGVGYILEWQKSGKRFREGEILLVLDECQLIFNSRNWQTKGRNLWLSFFSQHRKFAFDVILIAQFDGMIDKQIRTLIEYNCIHRKVSNFGKAGKAFSIFALGQLFVSVKYWYPLNERVSSEFFRSKRKFWSIYNSFRVFDLQMTLPEISANLRAEISKANQEGDKS